MINNSHFIGRETELQQLRELENKKTASLVVIRGRRRIGKSRLIKEFGTKTKFIDFMGLAPKPKITAQDQKDAFANKLSIHFNTRELKTDNWSDLLEALAQKTKKGKFVILLDEISWMATKDHTFLPKLKNAWDESFKNNPNLILVLCGSVSTWIQQNIISSSAFLGRISLELALEELPLKRSEELLTTLGFHGSAYEKLQILSVTAGIPWYLEQVRSNDHAVSFIQRLCFTKNGILTKDFENIFHDLFNKRSPIYRKILDLLCKGPLDYNQLCDKLHYRKSGRLSSYLENLVLSGFIKRDYTWSLETGDFARLSRFRLSDNYIRFYLKYIAKNLIKIEAGRIHAKSMTTFAGWETMMGLQFENLILQNRNLILEQLNIPVEDIIFDNPFFQRRTTVQKGCQIDYLIHTKYKTLYIVEIKFSRDPIPPKAIKDVQEKINRIKKPAGFACIPVLIHVNGVTQRVHEEEYFAKIINFCDFLKS